jgi:hypothetical protein
MALELHEASFWKNWKQHLSVSKNRKILNLDNYEIY